MKIGTIGYATEQGLGILVKAFYDHGIVTDVYVVNNHGRETHLEWYPSAQHANGYQLNTGDLRSFASKMDVMIFFETPFDWNLIPFCKAKGIKTILIPMYECMPKDLPAQPDHFFCPSLLDQEYFPERSTFLPIPVEVPWKQRTHAKTFVHNAGHLGLRGRNGTKELLQAMEYVNSPLHLILRGQTEELLELIKHKAPEAFDDPRISIHIGTFPHESLWAEGDVLVHPEHFNGLSLPLQEAYASGLLVIATDRFPARTWLPIEPLVPIEGYKTEQVSPRCLEFDYAVLHPRTIAKTLDEWYGKDITEFSLRGKEWGKQHSWTVLTPKYLEAIQCVSSM